MDDAERIEQEIFDEKMADRRELYALRADYKVAIREVNDLQDVIKHLRAKVAEAEQFLDDHTNHNNTTKVRDCIRLALAALRSTGDSDE